MPRHRPKPDRIIVAQLNGHAGYCIHNHTPHDQAVADLRDLATVQVADPILGTRPILRTDLLGRAAGGELEQLRRSPETKPFAAAIAQLLIDAGADPDAIAGEVAAVRVRLDGIAAGIRTYGR